MCQKDRKTGGFVLANMFANFHNLSGLHGVRLYTFSFLTGLFPEISLPKYPANQSVLSERTLPEDCYGIARARKHQLASYYLHSNTTMTSGHRLGSSK